MVSSCSTSHRADIPNTNTGSVMDILCSKMLRREKWQIVSEKQLLVLHIP